MKKIYTCTLIFALSLSFVACSKDVKSPQKTTTSTTTSTQTYAGNDQGSGNHTCGGGNDYSYNQEDPGNF